MGELALSGIRVLDLTRVLAGPYCGMLLGDLGADVIKVEENKKGDSTRAGSPAINGQSGYFMSVNRNKRGITLNLKTEKGKELFLSLVKKADVVLENYRPGVMDRLGIGYEVLSRVNPRIIYAAISGFGQTGPNAQIAGFDIVGQAMSGLMSISGWPDSGPTRSGAPLADTLAGLNATIGILSALWQRERTGKGQKIDVALVDATIAAMPTINMLYLVGGKQPDRMGNRYANTYPYDSFRSADGEFVLAAPYDNRWEKLCTVLGIPEAYENPDFSSLPLRIEHFVQVKEAIESSTRTRTSEENLALLSKAGFACAPIYSIGEAVADEHIAEYRNMYPTMHHPLAGDVRITNNAVKMSDSPFQIHHASPALGENNFDIFHGELGVSEQELVQLKEEDVI